MNGSKAVLDSNFLIFLSKGFLNRESLRPKYDKYFVSIITYVEVYAYEFKDPNQKLVLDETFDDLEILELSREIADQTIIYRKNSVKKIKLPDAVILASAKIVGADLITDNYSDFQNIDSSVNLVNLDDFKI